MYFPGEAQVRPGGMFWGPGIPDCRMCRTRRLIVTAAQANASRVAS